MKVYPKYKDSGVEWLGEIPDHWQVKKVKYCLDFFDNIRKPLSSDERGKMTEKVYDYYGASGVIDKVEDYLFEGGYILLGEDGANLLTRSTALAFKATGKFWVNNHAHILKPKNQSDIDYYAHILECDDYTVSVTGSAQPKLTQEALGIQITLEPPPSEQKTIATYLDRKTSVIDSLIEKKKRMIELLKEERAAIINCAVTKGINPDAEMIDSGIEWLGEVPKHWVVKKMKFLVSLRSGDSITADSIKDQGEYPVYGGNGLRGYTSSFTHEGEYVLIGRQGALCGNINYAKGQFWASEHAVVATNLHKTKTFWLGELLRTMNLNQYSVSAAQPGLAVERIQNLYIPCPSYNEQCEISNYLKDKLNQIEQSISKIEKENTLIEEYRTALINEAVTGKIDVREKV